MKYLGHLPRKDPFYGYLRYEILPQIGADGASPSFRVFGIRASNHVFLYEDRHTQTRLIGKFFGGISNRSSEIASGRMQREFNNLIHLRSIGFTGYPHYVPRPLSHNASLNYVVVEEFCNGRSLSDFILKAIWEGATDSLFQKLTALAYFIANMHNRTATGNRIDFNRDCSYFDQIISQLVNCGHISCDEIREFYRLKEQWREKGFMWEDNNVLVHGDLTPTNILFGDGLWVIAIDLERMKLADRVFDVGRVAAEIKHFFMQCSGDKARAEPFIEHFLWQYASHFPDRDRTFESITRRVPFYMGVTLLRIARNSWIFGKYREHLIDEARRTLR